MNKLFVTDIYSEEALIPNISIYLQILVMFIFPKIRSFMIHEVTDF